ncbi:class IV adenylate cyclase [Rhodopirellula sp. JC740]|uniref:Class IV adenylate cyclase n=1 Tax=Rhodopirellula halodulae TaxID=2894198 RepID=A0ABS8NEY6_9BACT|nr:class IV adenylate cyclase [Rhodopirellula sp. JC740]MCC9641497.1 class IV adenylate cyclase [Rhodopirellula sp. JC740]
MFEVELKFRVDDEAVLRARLDVEDAKSVSENENKDTYFNHPCRDFAASGEALRIRRIDGEPLITYKGPKLPGVVKAREELEWALNPGDAKGELTETLLLRLGFREVATVTKRRETFSVGSTRPMTVTIDRVEGLGVYAEIERVLAETKPDDNAIQNARAEVEALATKLGLSNPEPRSYLRMQLERADASAGG